MRKLVPPYIPYPGMYLNDLALIDEGNPSRVDGLINFRKYILLANSVDEFLRCQSAPCTAPIDCFDACLRLHFSPV